MVGSGAVRPLRRLLDLAYHAGIAQEEGRFPRFRLFSAPRTSPGRGHVSPRLLPPRPLTLPLLCKLAPAISLDRHALHVFEKDGEIFTDGVLSLTDLGLNRLAQALPGTAALDLQGAAGGLQVVVLDPGPNVQRWGAGRLEAGYGVFMIGNAKVTSVREVVERMLEPPAQGPGVRIVYAFPGNRGTNTQYLRLTEEDRASLRRTLAGMR